jgi:hypothetical protein
MNKKCSEPEENNEEWDGKMLNQVCDINETLELREIFFLC